jgi:AcrR family transcriptional regulator
MAERVLRADARRNQERLVSVAREAFQRYGVGAPLDEIARTAGVGPGTLYRHFPTREALLAAVYRDDVAGIATRAAELADELPPWEALAAFLREQLDYVGVKRGLGAALKVMLGNDTATLDWCRQTMRAAAGRLLERAQKDGLVRADLDAATVLRLVHGVGLATESAPESAEVMLSIVLSGLRPDPSEIPR